MSKHFVLAVLFCVVGICCAAEGQERSQPPRQRPANPFLNAEGKIDLTKVEESSLPNARKSIYKKADKDGDGFLDAEEMKTVIGRRSPRPDAKREGDRDNQSDGSRPPMMRGDREPQRGGGMPFMQNIMTEDGKIDLSKVEKSRMPEDQKKRFKAADKNEDGLLDKDELRSSMRNMPRPEGFGDNRFLFMRSVMTEDGKVDLAMLNKADKNGDGFLDRGELQALMPQDAQNSARPPRGSMKRPDKDQTRSGERPPRRNPPRNTSSDK